MNLSGSDATDRSMAASLERRNRGGPVRFLVFPARTRERREVEVTLIRSCLSGADDPSILAAPRVNDEEHLATDTAKGADARLAIVAPLVRCFENRAFKKHRNDASKIHAVLDEICAPLAFVPRRTFDEVTFCNYRCQYGRSCSAKGREGREQDGEASRRYSVIDLQRSSQPVADLRSSFTPSPMIRG
jgi:hypothetical protein